MDKCEANVFNYFPGNLIKIKQKDRSCEKIGLISLHQISQQFSGKIGKENFNKNVGRSFPQSIAFIL